MTDSSECIRNNEIVTEGIIVHIIRGKIFRKSKTVFPQVCG